MTKSKLLERIEKLERRVVVLECKHSYTLVERWNDHWTSRTIYTPEYWVRSMSLWRCTKCKHELRLGYEETPLGQG